MTNCALCRLIPEEVLYEDDVCSVVTCYTCKVPMTVLKRHDPNGTPHEVNHMKAVLEFLKTREEQYIDEQMRSIPEHKHMHLRG